MGPLLSYQSIGSGLDEFELDLGKLFISSKERTNFERKWISFYESDPANRDVFTKTEHHLKYLSESIIPINTDKRTPLALIFGNPAPSSVANELPFFFEANMREHRVWKVLRTTGLLTFGDDDRFTTSQAREIIKRRKARLLSMNYKSPFCIIFLNYFSIPSTSSQPPWSGVAGIKRLFGSQAFQKIALLEQQRIRAILTEIVSDCGIIVCFQKDAYNGLRHSKDQAYSLAASKEGTLVSRLGERKNADVYGFPPTRYMHSKIVKSKLRMLVE